MNFEKYLKLNGFMKKRVQSLALSPHALINHHKMMIYSTHHYMLVLNKYNPSRLQMQPFSLHCYSLNNEFIITPYKL